MASSCTSSWIQRHNSHLGQSSSLYPAMHSPTRCPEMTLVIEGLVVNPESTDVQFRRPTSSPRTRQLQPTSYRSGSISGDRAQPPYLLRSEVTGSRTRARRRSTPRSGYRKQPAMGYSPELTKGNNPAGCSLQQALSRGSISAGLCFEFPTLRSRSSHRRPTAGQRDYMPHSARQRGASQLWPGGCLGPVCW